LPDNTKRATVNNAVDRTPPVAAVTNTTSLSQPDGPSTTLPPETAPRVAGSRWPLFPPSHAAFASVNPDTSVAASKNPPPRNPVQPAAERNVDIEEKPEAAVEIIAQDMTPDEQTLPAYATPSATKALQRQLKNMIKLQISTNPSQRMWTLDLKKLDNLYIWYFTIDSFDPSIPLAQDMKRLKIKSINFQVIFGPQHPHTPPFVRVIRPRFKRWMEGGGGHVTVGGSICVEMLTMAGWKREYTMDYVLLAVHQALSDLDPVPARIIGTQTYTIQEAVTAYIRVANSHGWRVPQNWDTLFKNVK
jgi:ubiquitin-protein ligase